ncbi:hypothetical protein F5J12DRAFT_198907 [Pisolithus orientalis]|uniref:uncharacterized protein n=1 Tax=Pisolithus orientalis TaxID=936130 RepID=UPI0022249788|nr:uncharacterized protein F5J12DRAFT_198907 [Pisolithus orientalis]KAI6033135.1 hypothetical protein F5J12DRAFT_198907 [Pisolithus orientalis]
MSLSFGGISLLSSWSQLENWDDSVHPRTGYSSVVCVLVFILVVLILAYLTNPTEISFRTYLTEQAFRQHLSHLDDISDESGTKVDHDPLHSRSRSSSGSISFDRTTLPFRFSNRASVSLRTPKHVFHSFGVCTVATTRGATTTSTKRIGNTLNGAEHGAAVSADTWFIGAFGHWWRGGSADSWCYDAVVRSQDCEVWRSGILGFNASDKFSEYNGLLLPKSVSCSRLSQRAVAPKVRGVQGTGLLPRRNSTPPLPKSASLPLHADHRVRESLSSASPSFPRGTDPQQSATHAPSRTCSASSRQDHSPIITEVLRQIAAAQISVTELQAQLKEAQTYASQSHTLLEDELDQLRARKREDDQKRVEGRLRTKSLEEVRRVAETGRREAERRLKAARGTKESATRRVEELETEIGRLKRRIDQDRATLAPDPGNGDAEEERSLLSELEMKRKEVQIAEEVVTALNARARELEERIAESKERLRVAEEYSAKHDHENGYISGGYDQLGAHTWPSSYTRFDFPSVSGTLETENIQGFARESPNSTYSPRPLRFSLGSPSPTEVRNPIVPSTGARALFDEDASSTTLQGSQLISHGRFNHDDASSFSPFDVHIPSSAFIPSSLIRVLDSPSAEWRERHIGDMGGVAPSSSVVLGGASPSESDVDFSPYEARLSTETPDELFCDEMTLPYRTHSDPTAKTSDDLRFNAVSNNAESSPRRWFSISTKEKPRKGLNPDAKVFRLPRRKLDANPATDNHGAHSSYDMLNPSGHNSGIASSTPSLLRAFAPSRAEREALQRALGGSTNTSLELLPSLSDVGTIPPSPIQTQREGEHGTTAGEENHSLPVWLQSLPLISKPNFSPWEDEDVKAKNKGE